MGCGPSSPAEEVALNTQVLNVPYLDASQPGCPSSIGPVLLPGNSNAVLSIEGSEDVRSRYTFEKVLGKGQFGVTRLVVDKLTGDRW